MKRRSIARGMIRQLPNLPDHWVPGIARRDSDVLLDELEQISREKLARDYRMGRIVRKVALVAPE